MDAIEYKECNLTLRADKNSNTIPLRVTLGGRKDMPNHFFYVSKWQMQDYERAALKSRIQDMLHSVDIINEDNLIEKIIDVFPPVYLSAMGQPFPVEMLTQNPFEEGGHMHPLDAIAAELNKTNNNPGEN